MEAASTSFDVASFLFMGRVALNETGSSYRRSDILYFLIIVRKLSHRVENIFSPR